MKVLRIIDGTTGNIAVVKTKATPMKTAYDMDKKSRRAKRCARRACVLSAVAASVSFLSPAGGMAAEIVLRGTNIFQSAQIPPGLTDITAVSAGRDHVLALRQDGTVLGFGYNGDGRATPPAGLRNVTSIAAGVYDSLALKSDGTVAAWGFGGEGMTAVPAGLGDVVAIAAGGFHNLALLRNGTVTAWGYRGGGRTTPPAGLSRVIAIAAGRDHSVALKGDGTVAAWGQNDAGQTRVPAGLAGVTAIATGDAHTLALKSDGTVVAWGANDQGQCNVPASLAGVTQIAGGNGFSLALKSDGTVVGWGNRASGQADFEMAGLSSISAGGMESAALVGGGGLRITQGPASQPLLAGGSTTLSVAASGAPDLAYQWYFNGQPLAGATNATLELGQTGLGNAGGYRVVVSSGANSVASQVAVVQVWGGLAITDLQFTGPAAVSLTVGAWGGLSLSGPDFAGWTLQSSTNLFDWSDSTSQGTILNGRMQIADPEADAPSKFYRLKQAQ
jgi:hypothetical protein